MFKVTKIKDFINLLQTLSCNFLTSGKKVVTISRDVWGIIIALICYKIRDIKYYENFFPLMIGGSTLRTKSSELIRGFNKFRDRYVSLEWK